MKQTGTTQYLLPDRILRSSADPVYSQIYAQLKRELVLGNHNPGERFYSYRRLSEIYGVELRTVGSAVDLLLRDGLVEKRATSGIYVLKTEKHSEVGNVWFAVVDEKLYHPFYFNILLGLISDAEKYGLRVVVKIGGTAKDFLDWFVPRPGEGLVITGELSPELLKAAGKKCNGNVIVVGNYEFAGNFGTVHSRMKPSVAEALACSAEHHCRRPALITGPTARPISRQLAEIFTDHCRTFDLDSRTVSEPAEDGFSAMNRLEAFHPDCVLLTEPAFSGAAEYLFEHGMKCPDDIFLIRYGREKNDRFCSGHAAVDIECDGAVHGRTALLMLLRDSKETVEIDMKTVCRF